MKNLVEKFETLRPELLERNKFLSVLTELGNTILVTGFKNNMIMHHEVKMLMEFVEENNALIYFDANRVAGNVRVTLFESMKK